jgi:hypothetical protein
VFLTKKIKKRWKKMFVDPPLGAGEAIYRERFLLKGKVRREKMGKWCAICETWGEQCEKPAWHGTGKEVKAVRQEVVFGKWEEERRVDVEKGREVDVFKWVGDMMEAGEEREKYRAHGREIAVKVGEAREERIGKMKCDVCFVARKECFWPEVHFSKKKEWQAFCNEARDA